MKKHATAYKTQDCYKCGEKIRGTDQFPVGDFIKWAKRGDHEGVWYHADCISPRGNDADPNKDVPSPDTNPDTNPDDINDGLSRLGTAEERKHKKDMDDLEKGKERGYDNPYDDTPDDKDKLQRQMKEAAEEATKQKEELQDELKAQEDKHRKEEMELNKRMSRLERVVQKIKGLPDSGSEGPLTHFLVPTLLEMIQSNDTYLYSLPGNGKTHATKQVSEMLGLEYTSISLTPTSPDWKLVGYPLPSKNDKGEQEYFEGDFCHWYEFGGLHCIDEIDNGGGALLSSINTALSQGFFGFPKGMVTRHKDAKLIVTGNTVGLGGDIRFPDRQVLDSAFRNRFLFLDWELDEALELSIIMKIDKTLGLSWLEWVRTVRSYCALNFPHIIVGPRTSFQGAELMTSSFSLDIIANAAMWKGLDQDNVSMILDACPYGEKLEELII